MVEKYASGSSQTVNLSQASSPHILFLIDLVYLTRLLPFTSGQSLLHYLILDESLIFYCFRGRFTLTYLDISTGHVSLNLRRLDRRDLNSRHESESTSHPLDHSLTISHPQKKPISQSSYVAAFVALSIIIYQRNAGSFRYSRSRAKSATTPRWMHVHWHFRLSLSRRLSN